MVVVASAAATLLVFAAGVGAGVIAYHRVDPLRQDSVVMEDWFSANIRGDGSRMWQDASLDFQQHSAGREAYVSDNTHAPSTTAPRISFEASVALANGEEMFYTLRFTDGSTATLSLYVDDKGRFDGFTQ